MSSLDGNTESRSAELKSENAEQDERASSIKPPPSDTEEIDLMYRM